jgi:hypothetical protein
MSIADECNNWKLKWPKKSKETKIRKTTLVENENLEGKQFATAATRLDDY